MHIKILISVFALFFLLEGILKTGHAQGRSQNITHTVQAGETLYNISRQYSVSLDQLREWNNLSGNDIDIGQILIVGKEETEQPENAIIHEVQPDETMFSIAKQYEVTISEIRSWNNLSDNVLEAGQRLTIYQTNNGTGTAADRDTTESLVVDTPVTNNTYYTVKSGDTLYRIARDHNMSVDELKALNDLTSNTIRVGQRLTVRKTGPAAPSVSESTTESSPQGKFVVYTLEEQRDLTYILNRFEMAEEEFYALNPEIDSTTLQSGQKVTVLAPPTSKYKNPYTVQASLKNLGETVVVPYDSADIGQTTTSGELYNPDQLTGAHSNISLGNVIFVENPRSGKGVYIRINDRFSGNGLKLSHAAARTLELTSADSVTVNLYQNQ